MNRYALFQTYSWQWGAGVGRVEREFAVHGTGLEPGSDVLKSCRCRFPVIEGSLQRRSNIRDPHCAAQVPANDDERAIAPTCLESAKFQYSAPFQILFKLLLLYRKSLLVSSETNNIIARWGSLNHHRRLAKRRWRRT